MFTIGLSLEEGAFRIAVVKKEKKRIAVESLHEFPYGSESVKLFYNLPPFHTGKEVEIVSGLSSADVFIRKLHLPLRDKRKIIAALPFQLESLIPFSNENPIVCPLLKPLGKQMTSVTVIATAQGHLSSHLAILKGIDIEPDTVSCHPMALGRFARWKFSKEHRILCFDIRNKRISSAVFEGNELLLSQAISFDENENVSLELEKFSIFLKQKGVIDDETPWIMTGEATDSLIEILSRFFPGRKLEIPEKDLTQYAICIGLALDTIPKDGTGVQFCQNEFTPEHTFHLRRKKTLQYLGFCLGAALAMLIGGSFALNNKQRILNKNLRDYLSSSSLKEASFAPNQIQEKLHEWENSLKGQKTSFPLLPNVPKVSDVLAWISTHPAFATEDGEQKEGMEIKMLHYSLMKYPKIGETSSPYVAQVEIEFNSLAPRTARDFHDALLKGDQIVNAKKEVKWQAQNQTYYTSFELNKVNSQQ